MAWTQIILVVRALFKQRSDRLRHVQQSWGEWTKSTLSMVIRNSAECQDVIFHESGSLVPVSPILTGEC
eukprot:10830292-Karenia_brevis.AAC.1